LSKVTPDAGAGAEICLKEEESKNRTAAQQLPLVLEPSYGTGGVWSGIGLNHITQRCFWSVCALELDAKLQRRGLRIKSLWLGSALLMPTEKPTSAVPNVHKGGSQVCIGHTNPFGGSHSWYGYFMPRRPLHKYLDAAEPSFWPCFEPCLRTG
jgi:hypothetical protein